MSFDTGAAAVFLAHVEVPAVRLDCLLVNEMELETVCCEWNAARSARGNRVAGRATQIIARYRKIRGLVHHEFDVSEGISSV
jgi:hypothetical protein